MFQTGTNVAGKPLKLTKRLYKRFKLNCGYWWLAGHLVALALQQKESDNQIPGPSRGVTLDLPLHSTHTASLY